MRKNGSYEHRLTTKFVSETVFNGSADFAFYFATDEGERLGGPGNNSVIPGKHIVSAKSTHNWELYKEPEDYTEDRGYNRFFHIRLPSAFDPNKHNVITNGTYIPSKRAVRFRFDKYRNTFENTDTDREETYHSWFGEVNINISYKDPNVIGNQENSLVSGANNKVQTVQPSITVGIWVRTA